MEIVGLEIFLTVTTETVGTKEIKHYKFHIGQKHYIKFHNFQVLRIISINGKQTSTSTFLHHKLILKIKLLTFQAFFLFLDHDFAPELLKMRLFQAWNYPQKITRPARVCG